MSDNQDSVIDKLGDAVEDGKKLVATPGKTVSSG